MAAFKKMHLIGCLEEMLNAERVEGQRKEVGIGSGKTTN